MPPPAASKAYGTMHGSGGLGIVGDARAKARAAAKVAQGDEDDEFGAGSGGGKSYSAAL